MRILIADDEPEITRTLRTALEHQKYSIDAVDNGRDALDYILEGKYDGVILDIMMPQMDGIQVLQNLRERGCKVPVLLLTARDALQDRVDGLDAGADDFLPKPFAVTELLARVRAMLRRGESYTSDILRMGNLALNCATFELSVGEEACRLGNKEFQLMACFLRNPRIIFTADELMERIWGWECTAEINVVWTNIAYLRKKLRVLGADVQIKSIRNVGYCLTEAADTDSGDTP